MKIVTELFQHVIEVNQTQVKSLIIENQKVMYQFITEIYNAINSSDTSIIFSEDDKIIKASGRVELITTFVPFVINEKRLINKVIGLLQEEALNELHYNETMELLSKIERYVSKLSASLPYDIETSGLDALSLIKMCGITIYDDSISDIERVFHYMKIVRDLLGDKLFIFVNIGSFFDENDVKSFSAMVVVHGFNVLLIDNKEYDFGTSVIKKLIIDKDLCII